MSRLCHLYSSARNSPHTTILSIICLQCIQLKSRQCAYAQTLRLHVGADLQLPVRENKFVHPSREDAAVVLHR
jgi:hypothetical protein